MQWSLHYSLSTYAHLGHYCTNRIIGFFTKYELTVFVECLVTNILWLLVCSML